MTQPKPRPRSPATQQQQLLLLRLLPHILLLLLLSCTPTATLTPLQGCLHLTYTAPSSHHCQLWFAFQKRFLVPTKAGLTRSDSWFKHKQAWNKSCRKTEESFTLKHTQLFMLPSPLDILTGFTSPCNMLILQIRRWDQQLLWTSSAVFVQTWYSPHFRGSNHRYLKAFWASNKLRNAYGGGLKATELTFCIILSCPFRLRHGKGVQCTDMHELTSKAPQHFSSWLV